MYQPSSMFEAGEIKQIQKVLFLERPVEHFLPCLASLGEVSLGRVSLLEIIKYQRCEAKLGYS